MLRLSRLIMVVVGVITLVIAFFSPIDIFWLTYFVGTLFASSWGPVALMSVWSRNITADAAFWGIVSGFAFNVVPKALEYLGWINLPFWLDPILLGGLVSLMVVLVVSRSGRVSRKEEIYRLRLHEVPRQDASTAKLRFTRYAPLVLVVYSLSISVILFTIYVQPYQDATGTLSADGSINWLSGESLLVLLICGADVRAETHPPVDDVFIGPVTGPTGVELKDDVIVVRHDRIAKQINSKHISQLQDSVFQPTPSMIEVGRFVPATQPCSAYTP